jgi:hypothetical protein
LKVKEYYVYFLIDPRDKKVFYVGKGKDKRIDAHMKQWLKKQNININKDNRINEIETDGYQVIKQIYKDKLSEKEAFKIEREMIDKFGIDNLTNIAPYQITNKERSKRFGQAYLRKVKPFDIWINEKPRTDFEINLYHFVSQQLIKMTNF